MTELKELQPVTIQEFEAMEKKEQFHYELIDGIILMSPSPSREHQKIAGNLYIKLRLGLEQTKCDVLYELDIVHNENIYRPDLLIFCDAEDEVPEIVIEVLSPTSRQRDLRVKVVKYEELGVKEYWIVDPKVKTVTVHDFVNDTADSYGIDDTIYSLVRPELVIQVADLF